MNALRWCSLILLLAGVSPLFPASPFMAQVQLRRPVFNRNEESNPDLPIITQFQTNRSDRFLVDIEYLSAGHPFKGRRAVQPHQGAHLHWDNSGNTWPKGGIAVSNYPAIYAVVD